MLRTALFLAALASPALAAETESDYRDRLCGGAGMKMEVKMPNGTRADCMTDRLAIEIDWAHKWAEAIGQSMNYAASTGKLPAAILICKRGDGYLKIVPKSSADEFRSLAQRILSALHSPAHSGEREALERAARRLIDSDLAEQIRKLVAGWNGEGVPEEYRMGRHDDALGVTLPTNCGAIYMLDEVLSAFRAALEAKP